MKHFSEYTIRDFEDLSWSEMGRDKFNDLIGLKNGWKYAFESGICNYVLKHYVHEMNEIQDVIFIIEIQKRKARKTTEKRSKNK